MAHSAMTQVSSLHTFSTGKTLKVSDNIYTGNTSSSHFTQHHRTPPSKTHTIPKPPPYLNKLAELQNPSEAIIDMNHITSRHFQTKSAKKSIWLPKFHSAHALKALLKSGTSAETPKYTTPKGTKYLDGIRILQTIVLTHKYHHEVGYYPDGKDRTRTLTKFAKFVFYQILPKYSETHDAIFILRTAYPIPPSK